jgi:hypothetical protein
VPRRGPCSAKNLNGVDQIPVNQLVKDVKAIFSAFGHCFIDLGRIYKSAAGHLGDLLGTGIGGGDHLA